MFVCVGVCVSVWLHMGVCLYSHLYIAAAAINQIGLNTISLNAVTEQEVVPQAQKIKYFNWILEDFSCIFSGGARLEYSYGNFFLHVINS